MTLDDVAELTWKVLPATPKTIENYHGAYKRNLKANLGSKKIGEISRAEILNNLAGLQPPNYFQTLMALRVIYREALAREIVNDSPPAKIRPPRINPKPQKFLTWEQVRDQNFGKHDSHIKFLALHGLRWGEAVALSADDIKDGVVNITKSKYGPTKSKAGIRKVPYMGFFKPFPKSRRAIANKLSESEVTIHSLRKTYAYFLKTNKVHVTTAAKFMGHSNPLVTLKIYTLVLDDEVETVGNELRDAIYRHSMKE